MATLQKIGKEQIIPIEYTPTEQITFCGNEISNYRFLINDKGFYPVLIGAGEIPRIWLYYKSNKNDIIKLVDDSVSNSNSIKVDIFTFEKKIVISDTYNKIVILELNYINKPSIDVFDLRPIGYNIYGDKTKLVLQNTTLSNNTFTNVTTIIALG